MPLRTLASLLALLALAACADEPPPPAPTAATAPDEALAAIDSTTLRRHLAELASDAYEGRGTGTPGEERAVQYIAAEMEAAGLVGAAEDGGFFQPVPLLGSTPTEVSPLVFTAAGGETVELQFFDDFIASTDLDAAEARFDAPLVFVGYGITNPGYDWDDYKDVDVAGTVLVAFVNDPPATEAEPTLFQADTL
ncbi:MAG: hypothetical protein R3362_02655, partial [Rhodothermales bacterium]|nr:hypothetical protein [Rhodothermales bacterium]